MNWIDIEDQDPPYEEPILVCDAISQEITIGNHIEGEDEDVIDSLQHFYRPLSPDFRVTHWMPLPELPNCPFCKNEIVACVCMD